MVWDVWRKGVRLSRLKFTFIFMDSPYCGNGHVVVYSHLLFRFHPVCFEPWCQHYASDDVAFGEFVGGKSRVHVLGLFLGARRAHQE